MSKGSGHPWEYMASLELHCSKGVHLFYTCSPINTVMYVEISYVCILYAHSMCVCVTLYWYLALFHCLLNVLRTVRVFLVDQFCGIAFYYVNYLRAILH